MGQLPEFKKRGEKIDKFGKYAALALVIVFIALLLGISNSFNGKISLIVALVAFSAAIAIHTIKIMPLVWQLYPVLERCSEKEREQIEQYIRQKPLVAAFCVDVLSKPLRSLHQPFYEPGIIRTTYYAGSQLVALAFSAVLLLAAIYVALR